MLFTYIIETSSDEYYCGITTDVQRRLQEHRNEQYPKWFCNPMRRKCNLVLTIKGDFEKEIKWFGIQKFYNIAINIHNDKETKVST